MTLQTVADVLAATCLITGAQLSLAAGVGLLRCDQLRPDRPRPPVTVGDDVAALHVEGGLRAAVLGAKVLNWPREALPVPA